VMDKGFGFWLSQMLGTVATSGPVSTYYTHTGSDSTTNPAALIGDSFTAQINKPFHPADTDYVITCYGTKITKWKMSDSAGNSDPLKLEADIYAMNFDDDTTLASASYPSGDVEPLTFVGGTCTIGGSSVQITEWSLEHDAKLKIDDRKIKGSALPVEPVEEDRREIKWEVGDDFGSEAHYDYFASASAAGAVAQIVLTYTGLILVGSSTYPSLTITIDEASFDMHETSDPSKPLTQKFGGSGLFDGSASAITLAYASADSTA